MKKQKYMKKSLVGVVIFIMGCVVGFCVRDVSHKDTATFIGQWVAHPTEVGALTPCSEYVVEEIVRPIMESKLDQLAVLEVGSGPGVVTEKIVAALSGKQYHLDLVEINDTFIGMLQKKYQNNPSVTINHADITQWKPTREYDIIISTLPFNIFEKATIAQILSSYESWVKEGGAITFIELAGLGDIGEVLMIGDAKEEHSEKRALVAEFRQKYLEKKVTVFKNIPPIHVYHLKINHE